MGSNSTLSPLKLVPPPVQYALEGVNNIRSGNVEGGYDSPQKQAVDVIKAISRTILAGAGFLAFKSIGASPLISGAVGCTLSLPATAVVVGGSLVFKGLTGVVSSAAAYAFYELGISFVTLLGGWLILKAHYILPFGLLESYVVDPLAQRCAPGLVEYLGKKSE